MIKENGKIDMDVLNNSLYSSFSSENPFTKSIDFKEPIESISTFVELKKPQTNSINPFQINNEENDSVFNCIFYRRIY